MTVPHEDNFMACDSACQRLVAANWKMNGSSESNKQLLEALRHSLAEHPAPETQTLICAPYVYLPQLASSLRGTGVSFGAQDLSAHDNGAYTGEISAGMLKDIGCEWVIVGHSERRQYHHESSSLVTAKAKQALNCGLRPIICIGESLAEHDSAQTFEVISRQLEPLWDLDGKQWARVVIAYEPVWAIGSGRSATPEQAQEIHEFIRAQLREHTDAPVKLLYGGSVKADNAGGFFAMKDIDGVLVGGASLHAEEFLSIIRA